jgi:N-terminal acetyltransferase B complex non-catalytic subunit
VVEFYAKAVEQVPQDEEMHAQWFMACVRARQFKGQQLAALKMSKQFKSPRYFFWHVMSVVVQVSLN